MNEQWQELKETITEMRDNDGTGTQQEVCKFLANLMDVLEKQMQEPKTGHWISHYDEDAKEGWYECDRCHTERAFNTDYCPDCGAKMESEDKE